MWLLGIALDGDSDNDGLVKLDVMNEGELSLANTGSGSSAVPASSYVSSVSGPPQRPVEVSYGLTPVKEHLALMVERLKDCGFDLVAAFAELLAATFALSDALFAATPAAYFLTAAAALPLASFGLILPAVVPWGMGGLLQGPDCFQPYPGKLAALVAALMGAATCLAALLAAKRLAAITGRLVSACFTGLRWKLLAGKDKDKLLSGWVPCSPWTRVVLQIPQVGRCRATVSVATVLYLCSSAPTKRVLSLLRMSRTSRRITSPRASRNVRRWMTSVRGSSFGMSRWQQQEKELPLSAVFEERSKGNIDG